MKPLLSAALLSVLILFAACNQDKKPHIPESLGTPSEIVMVSESNLWSSSAGDSIRAFFEGPVPGLPQPEAFYKLIQVKEDGFISILKIHRNVFIITIDSSLQKPALEMLQNVWSKPQRVVKIASPTVEGIKETFEENKDKILNLYDNAEMDRLQKLYSKSKDIEAITAIEKKFGFSLNIPADYFVAIEKDNFIWLRRETNLESQGILIYAYPYTDTVAFNSRKIQSVRNQFTQLYVPGPSDSSFMAIADEYIEPIARSVSLKNQPATELRGLWEVRKDFMGGPFVSYTFVDEKNNMVVTIDGYVYAPGINKLAMLKQVQSILLSFKYIDNQ